MAINPTKILIEVLDTVQPTINISSVDSLGGGSYKLYVDNTFYLRTLKTVTIDAIEYDVTDFEIDEFLTVSASDGTDVPVVASSFTISNPSFYYGNPQMVSAEIVKRMENGTLTWPYIWAVELSNTDKTLDPSSAVKATKSFNLFFFDSADVKNWTIEEHYNQDIYPLSNYIDYFFSVLQSRRDLFDADSITWDESDHVNMGEYVVDEGMVSKILADGVTGIQVEAEIPFMDRGCNPRDIVAKCFPVSETFNGSVITSIPSGGSKDIVVQTDAPGNPQTGAVITDTASSLVVQVGAATTVGPTGGIYKSGVENSYNTGDEANDPPGYGTDFFNLGFNNPFGHGFRISGTTGGYTDGTSYFDVNGVATTKALAFPNDVAIYWDTNNQSANNVFAVWFNPIAADSVTDHIAAQPFTNDGKSDWKMITLKQFFKIAGDVSNTDGWLDYLPIERPYSTSSDRIWTRTPAEITNFYFFWTGFFISRSNAGTYETFVTRLYTLTELGL